MLTQSALLSASIIDDWVPAIASNVITGGSKESFTDTYSATPFLGLLGHRFYLFAQGFEFTVLAVLILILHLRGCCPYLCRITAATALLLEQMYGVSIHVHIGKLVHDALSLLLAQVCPGNGEFIRVFHIVARPCNLLSFVDFPDPLSVRVDPGCRP